jgi:hypothetical protein
VRNYANSDKKPVILGEFGQSYFDKRYDDALQARVTENYIRPAFEVIRRHQASESGAKNGID